MRFNSSLRLELHMGTRGREEAAPLPGNKVDRCGARGGDAPRKPARLGHWASRRRERAVALFSPSSQAQLQVDDGYLIALAKQGHASAYDSIVRRYYGFVR